LNLLSTSSDFYGTRYAINPCCRSQWSSGLRHELFSPAPTLRSWVRIPLRHGCLIYVCVCSVCVFSVST
jgi:hypothetical protein